MPLTIVDLYPPRNFYVLILSRTWPNQRSIEQLLSIVLICFVIKNYKQIAKLQLYHIHISMIKIVIYTFIVLWGAFALFAYKNVKRIIAKYRNIPQVQPLDKWKAFLRQDFNKWNQRNIIIGCFTRFPFKIITLLSMFFGFYFIIRFLSRNNQRSIIKLILQKTIYFLFSIQFTEQPKPISTPIVISNHVNWFDVIFFEIMFFPLSIVAKQDVKNIPLIGKIGEILQLIFIDRRNPEARSHTLAKIQQRVNNYSFDKQNFNPLLIFPQGTTTNGKSICSFKQGAFHPKAPITIFGFQYTCEGFDMGMQQITQLQHLIISLSLKPHLRVSFKELTCGKDQSVEEYMLRAQKQLSLLTGYQVFQGGFQDKCQLQKQRKQIKQQ